MNYTEQAIQKAIMDGGYGPSFWRTRHQRDPHTEWKGWEWDEVYSENARKTMYLDPFFWQSLGKALGWEGLYPMLWEGHELYWRGGNGHQYQAHEEYWMHKWHRFIDHLAEGQDAESYFKQLLG
jgi:hypothetical protein